MRQLRVLVACECSGRVRDAFAARGWEAWSADILPSDTPVIGTYTNEQKALVSALGERIGTGYHYQGDCRNLFDWNHPVNSQRKLTRGRTPWAPLWHLVIAHPPCTDLSLAGAVHWKKKDIARGGDGRMQEGAAFFMDMVYASRGNDPSAAPFIAVENPHGRMNKWYRQPDQVVEPYWFGDPYEKKLCVWTRGGLPLLTADNLVTPLTRAVTGGGNWETDKDKSWRTGQVMPGESRTYEDSKGRALRSKVRSETFPGFARAMADQWGPFVEGLG